MSSPNHAKQQNEFEWGKALNSIKKMNLAFQPITCVNQTPTNLGTERLQEFIQTIKKELEESDQILESIEYGNFDDAYVGLGDLLADLIVFVVSESYRWGLPIGLILGAVMRSQESKLVDGKAIQHPTEPGKFGKGPNYQPPEKRIAEILKHYVDCFENSPE
jgi:hypothetical protein